MPSHRQPITVHVEDRIGAEKDQRVALALGWAVGQLQGRDVDIPSWVSNVVYEVLRP